MLVLSRKPRTKVFVDGGRIVITVVEIVGGKVRLGFEAAPGVVIDREEIHLDKLAIAADAARSQRQ